MPKAKSVVPEILKVYSDASDIFLASKMDVSRLKYLRPSQLPFCPVSFFVNHAKQGLVRTRQLTSDFYTSVGTAVHTVVQTFLSQSGKFLASWECPVCNKRYKVTTKHECCDNVMNYHEVEINYKGIVGHIDAIFKDSKGRYWILDFKTCSVVGALKKQKNPGASYIEQVEAYALLLWLQYGIKVQGVMLMFIRRNNPVEPVVWSKELDDKDYARIKKRMIAYKRAHKEVLNLRSRAEALALIEKYGRCKGEFCKICRSSRSLKDQVKDAYKIGNDRGRIPLASMCR